MYIGPELWLPMEKQEHTMSDLDMDIHYTAAMHFRRMKLGTCDGKLLRSGKSDFQMFVMKIDNRNLT